VKVLALASTADGRARLDALSEAARAFNRALDIRLRFLDIGVDLIRLEPLEGQERKVEAAGWEERTRRALERERPLLLQVYVDDPTADPGTRAALAARVRPVAFGPLGPDADAYRERFPGVAFHQIDDAVGDAARVVDRLVDERPLS